MSLWELKLVGKLSVFQFGDEIMKRVSFISMVLITCCGLFFVAGCQEQAKMPDTSQGKLTETPVLTNSDNAQNSAKPAKTTNSSSQTINSKLASAKKGPRITFKNEVHDFGELKPITKNKCEFTFTNTGDAELKIKNVRSTCGCTVAQLSKKNYAPGESGTIKVVYTSTARAASINKVIYVTSNDKTRPRVGLTLKGKTVLPVRHTPTSMKLLLNEKNAKCPNITLTCVDNQPFAIKSFTATAGCMSAVFDPNVKQTKFVIEPKVDLTKLERALSGNITIGLTHPKCRSVSIHYSVMPRFNLNPSSLLVQNVEPGQTTNRIVWVVNNYKEDFEIESLTSKAGYIKVLSKEKLGTRYKLELQITPPAPEPNEKLRVFKDSLVIKIKGGKELTVYCRGFYSTKPKT